MNKNLIYDMNYYNNYIIFFLNLFKFYLIFNNIFLVQPFYKFHPMMFDRLFLRQL